MDILRTNKTELEPQDVVNYIKSYENSQVPKFDKLWNYYLGKNPTILSRKNYTNNPENKTPVSYGRKIITTFTGYAYRPGYISYKSDNESLLKELQTTFDENNEKIKTGQHGRNTGIFGCSYELLYMGVNRKTGGAEIKFSVIDPREMILIYDYSLEPVKKFAIRYYSVDDATIKADVYDDKNVTHYDLTKPEYGDEYKIVAGETESHFFPEVPVIPYYNGQDKQGIIEPVVGLIDDFDILVSDSMIEFDRFANSYLKLVGMSMDNADQKNLKKNRIFENLSDKDAVSFLTKDIPTAYIDFMSKLIREQIHIQSHVPDLSSGSFADGVSGVAVDRLMFDFENVCSNAEAEFDTGLKERIRLIITMYNVQTRAAGTFDEIDITHKRNKPNNIAEYAQIAVALKNAGFSDYAICDAMPDELIPDVEAELERRKEEQETAIPDVEALAQDEPRQPEQIAETNE